jgi:hypothetical protein
LYLEVIWMTCQMAACRWAWCPGCGKERRLARSREVMRAHNRWNPVTCAMVACRLVALAAAAAAVSFAAQYRMVYTARRLAIVAALEAAIPDAAALVFASLGIALALYGRRAIRARALNLAAP